MVNVAFVYPNKNELRIKSIEKYAGGWRCPNGDENSYHLDDVMKIIGFPVPVNNRGTYDVAELDKD